MGRAGDLWRWLSGDGLSRADRLLQQGKLERAAAVYAKAGRFREAAGAARQGGDLESAVRYLDLASLDFEAAELLEGAGRPGEAVERFERAGLPLRAAKAARSARQPLRAASLLLREHRFVEAASAYQEGDDYDGALRALELEAQSLQDQGAGSERLRTNALRRARVLVQVGRTVDAIASLQDAQHPSAATLPREAGPALESLDRLLRSSLVQDEALDHRATELSTELRLRMHDERTARGTSPRVETAASDAQSREIAGDLRGAAELLLEDGEHLRAGSLFERVGDVEKAAQSYSVAGEMAAAGRCFELAGQPRRAAGCYLLANEPVKAASAFLEVSDVRSALRAIESIDVIDPSYEEATLLVAQTLFEAGEWEELLQRLALVPELTSSRDGVLARRYWQGRCLASLGRPEEAERVLGAVVELEPDYLDARDQLAQLERLQARVRKEGPPVPAPTGRVGVGDVVAGRYELREQIGQGGMSIIFRALDLESREMVAVKTLVAVAHVDPTAEDRMLREAQLCRRITHENVVRVIDFGRFDQGVYVTMEVLQGLTLDALLTEKRTFAVTEATSILSDILEGLVAVHEARVIHRDIKPANLAVTPERVKIMDFGIALAPGNDVALTQPGQVMGSPMYMSPEQIQGLDLDERTDLYSLGVVGFTILSGREPFTGKTPADVVLKHLQDAPPDLRKLRVDVPESLVRLIERLLSKNRDERPSRASDVLEMLRAAVDEELT